MSEEDPVIALYARLGTAVMAVNEALKVAEANGWPIASADLRRAQAALMKAARRCESRMSLPTNLCIREVAP